MKKKTLEDPQALYNGSVSAEKSEYRPDLFYSMTDLDGRIDSALSDIACNRTYSTSEVDNEMRTKFPWL